MLSNVRLYDELALDLDLNSFPETPLRMGWSICSVGTASISTSQPTSRNVSLSDGVKDTSSISPAGTGNADPPD